MKPLTLALSTFVTGSLITGGAIGTLAYFKIDELKAENTHLDKVVKNQKKKLAKLKKNQSELNEAFEGFKQKKVLEDQQTQTELKTARETGGLEALYSLGLKALEEKDASRAFFALTEVAEANPQFKDIQKHLPQAKQAYQQAQNASRNQKLETLYAKAFDHQAKMELAQAKAAYAEVVKLNSKYKDAKKRMDMVNSQLAMRNKKTTFKQEQAWLADQYKMGVDYQKQGSYAQAKLNFEAILNFASNYKDTSKRLVQVIAAMPSPPPKLSQASVKPTSNDATCYQKGVSFGSCYALVAAGKQCNTYNLSNPPEECKADPEFKKGFQTTAPSGASQALRGLSNFLKNM